MEPGCEWYGCDNLLRDGMPGLVRDGHPATGAGWLAIVNPDPEHDADVTITLYASELQTEPLTHAVTASPGRMTLVHLHDVPGLPRNTFFGLGLRSDRPVLPQSTWFEFRPFDLHPDATISKTLYPGPLTAHEWYFPDGWQGGNPGANMLWYERETLLLLNPSDKEATVTATFYGYGRTADVEFLVAPRRLKVVPLYDIPGLRFRWVPERQTTMVDFSIRIVSNVPLVPQKTRRAYVQTEASVQGMWTSFGYPYALAEQQQRTGSRLWYYPGGYVQDVGNYPQSEQNMLGWDLFFSFNPDPERATKVSAEFLYEDSPAQTLEFTVEPQCQKLFWLHHTEYQHLTGHNQPYGVIVAADGPLVPHFLRAEYESWLWNSPTAMFGVIPYEGPLTGETEWWVPEGFWQDREDHPWVEQEWLQILNPGEQDAEVTVRFLLEGDIVDHHLPVPARRLRVVKLEDLERVPAGSHYAVQVQSSAPVVVQQSRRTFKKGGTNSTLSTTATLGIPYHTAPWPEVADA